MLTGGACVPGWCVRRTEWGRLFCSQRSQSSPGLGEIHGALCLLGSGLLKWCSGTRRDPDSAREGEGRHLASRAEELLRTPCSPASACRKLTLRLQVRRSDTSFHISMCITLFSYLALMSESTSTFQMGFYFFVPWQNLGTALSLGF